MFSAPLSEASFFTLWGKTFFLLLFRLSSLREREKGEKTFLVERESREERTETKEEEDCEGNKEVEKRALPLFLVSEREKRRASRTEWKTLVVGLGLAEESEAVSSRRRRSRREKKKEKEKNREEPRRAQGEDKEEEEEEDRTWQFFLVETDVLRKIQGLCCVRKRQGGREEAKKRGAKEEESTEEEPSEKARTMEGEEGRAF